MQSRLRTFFFVCNVIATLLLAGSLAVVYGWPEYLAAVRFDVAQGQMFVLTLVSFLLLVAYLQRSVVGAWRVFTLAGAFIVLVESWLIALT
ncbi:MAG: hypothetical protein FJX76_20670 [Armatimonadetes bacterium]|nr:hypothetical protein [Armatimonadota bacterium]